MTDSKNDLPEYKYKLVSCLSFNAARLVKNAACDSLRQYCSSAEIDIVCVTETWASSETVSSAELSMGCYNVYRRDRFGRAGGGVCILARPDLKCCEVSANTVSETVAVDIMCGTNMMHRIICTYFSPTGESTELARRMAELCNDLEELVQVDYPVIITGDLNQPAINWHPITIPDSETSKEYLLTTFCIANGLTQLVTIPTRKHNILDVILTDAVDSITDLKVCAPPVKSDHMALTFKLAVRQSLPQRKERLNYGKMDFDAIAANLALTNWSLFFFECDSVQSQYMKFLELITYLVEGFTPFCQPPFSRIDAFIRRASAALEHDMTPDKRRTLTRQLTRAATRNRRLEEKRLNIRDAKSFFRYANKRLNLHSGISPLKVEDSTLVENLDKAHALMQYFESVYIPSGQSVNLPPSTPAAHLNDITFSADVVLQKMQTLKRRSSVTPDRLPPILFAQLADVLAGPLSIILTRSFEDGEVPTLFKESIVTAIHKKGKRYLPENYRPVAQCVIPCLIMEKIVVDNITEFLSANGHLDPNQHGFTKGRSTETQLLEVSQDWALARNRRVTLHVLYFDFSRAFDRVDHTLLLVKIASLGIGPRIIKWLNAYLSDRTFRVRVDDSLSSSGRCTSGVPQGSCLGPLLYAIFVTDLGRALSALNVTYKMYADDLKVYTEVHSDRDRTELQKAVNLISSWSKANRMEISVPKCAILKTIPDDAKYYLDGNIINEVNAYKDLGVTFDRQLKFRQHIVETATAATRLCNLLLRTFILQDLKMYIKLYETIVVPKLTYCAHVWAPFHGKDVALLQRVQDRFIKRLSWRCKIARAEIVLPSVEEYQRRVDTRIFRQIIKENRLSKFFTVRTNNLRSGVTIHALEIANAEVVNNAFAWRLARRARDDDKICDLLKPLF